MSYFRKGNVTISLDVAKKMADELRYKVPPEQFAKLMEKTENDLKHSDVHEFRKHVEKVKNSGWNFEYALDLALQYRKYYDEPKLTNYRKEIEGFLKPRDRETYRERLFQIEKAQKEVEALVKHLGMGKKPGGY